MIGGKPRLPRRGQDIPRSKKEKTVEKLYKRLTGAGAMSLVLGIVTAAVGVAAGVLGIVNGARLLRARRELER